MKLDVDFIEQILAAVEEHPDSQIIQPVLLKALDIDRNDKQQVDKFYYHMMRIYEVGFLESEDEEFGFLKSCNGWIASGADYELTWDGHQFLDAIRNDTLKDKVKDWLKDMSLEQFKTRFPTLIIGMLTSGAL